MFRAPSIVSVMAAIVRAKLFVLVLTISSQALAVSDPTKPYGHGAARKATTTYKLNSVLISDARKVAVINGKIYSEGEKLPLGTVAKIKSDHVVINGKRRHVLTLGVEPIRK